MSFQLKKKKKEWAEKKIDTNRITAGELIDDKPEEVIDLSSIKELTQTRYEIKMTSFDDTSKSWTGSLYCKREKHGGIIEKSSQGHIKWLVENEE